MFKVSFHFAVYLNPFRAPEPLPILNPSIFPQKRVYSCKGVNSACPGYEIAWSSGCTVVFFCRPSLGLVWTPSNEEPGQNWVHPYCITCPALEASSRGIEADPTCSRCDQGVTLMHTLHRRTSRQSLLHIISLSL